MAEHEGGHTPFYADITYALREGGRQRVTNRRWQECETAARLLEVNTLRDADSLLRISDLPAPYDRRVLAALNASPERFGARLTGAGFGGACIALVQKGAGESAATAALRHFAALGFEHGRSLL